MADQFSKSVELGLKLSKRISYGKERPAPAVMERMNSEKNYDGTADFLPTGPMVYAVISEPSIVDNPDIPSYQPYVHGRCEPPALIPLHMHGITMEVDCYLDTAFITVSGTWRMHCVTASKSCDCRIAVPMGEQGSILGVQVECLPRSYSTQLIPLEENQDADKAKDGFLLKGRIYTLKIPQVDGGSSLSVRISWSQKLLYQDNEFCLKIPFSFPPYVTPVFKKMTKMERIVLSLNSGTGLEILCKSASHPLKLNRQAGKLQFSYEREVSMWSMNDFSFLYSVSSSDIFGNVLLQSPPLHDFDQRDMFCFCLYPGNSNRKIFQKEVIFIIDISASMRGNPLDNAKTALLTALSKLDPADTFNIIAFNDRSLLFSSNMEQATKEAIEKAYQWISNNFIADGGTNISIPLSQALKMMSKSKSGDLISLIFLITDGSVEDERDICAVMKRQLMDGSLNCPRIHTFGIGSYCNHYFLQMLAQIGRGYYDAAYDVDSINFRMERLFNQASSIILADISIDGLEHVNSLELYPSHLPDLSSGSPLIVSGRYTGNFPDFVKFSGTLADLGNFITNAKVQKAKDFPMERVLAKSQIDTLTANAWLSESKQLEEKIVKMSLQTGVSSEYTDIILIETKKEKQINELSGKKIIILRSVGVGFGSLKATADNLPPETAEPKLHETSEMILQAATNWCGKMIDCCCCMCFIQFCNQLNDQCAVVLTQLCTALACFGCMNFCCEVCFSCDFCN
ncbi:hypothetical protein ACH5RR_024317 [Cinchona calisaya]|uniref:VWFA domain-containing protein n=1 Tax=Cinchona calisaya TaxID=153742 RepID=A0ABD2YZV9_9GENT